MIKKLYFWEKKDVDFNLGTMLLYCQSHTTLNSKKLLDHDGVTYNVTPKPG